MLCSLPLSVRTPSFIPEFPFLNSFRSPRRLTTLRRPRPSTPSSLKSPPKAAFLPPDGPPPIPDDDDPVEPFFDDQPNDKNSKQPPSTWRPRQGSPTRLSSIDRLLEETTPDYSNWIENNARRSLSTLKHGERHMLGADELNEAMRPTHLQRHRHVLAPDEAFAAIFSWDVVVSNSRELERLSWAAVANEASLPPPDITDIVRAEEMAPEAAVSRVFYWTDDWGEIKRHVFRKHEFFQQLQSHFDFEASEGIETFLFSLEKYGVKCVLCAAKPRHTIEHIISHIGLSRYFSKNEIVSSDDEFDSLEQMFLIAALKSERPPGRCVVFTDKPSGITAGHEVSSKVVAIVGAHPAYEIKTADQTVRDFDELVVYNIRRLFSEEGAEFMDPQTELERERK